MENTDNGVFHEVYTFVIQDLRGEMQPRITGKEKEIISPEWKLHEASPESCRRTEQTV